MILRPLISALLAVFLLSPAAFAAATRDQQRCINAMNRLGARLASAQNRANAACLAATARAVASASVRRETPDPCAATSVAVGRLLADLGVKDAALCLSPGRRPDFGYAGAAAIASAATAESRGIRDDVFGADLVAATSRAGANASASKCQAAILARTHRLFETLWGVALTAKRHVLAGDARGRSAAVGSAAALRDAIVTRVTAGDPRIARAIALLDASTRTRCRGVDLATAFPGACRSATDAGALAACAEAIARRRFYHALAAFDALPIACDLTDDGARNWSCLPPEAVEHVLNRTGYGPDAFSRQRIAELGPRAYIEEQLHPEDIANAELDALLERFPSLTMDFQALRVHYPGGDANAEQPRIGDVLKELQRAKVLRAIVSRRQLEEVLTDFWFNHFNVLAVDRRAYDISPYERLAIRPYVLGRFRDLLLAAARSPAMGDYLDNRHSRAGAINENFGREFLELHTVGVEAGYDERDVGDVVRAFTGWREDFFAFDGFKFEPAWHDGGPKSLMDELVMPGGRGYLDGADVIDFVSTHPATAERVSRKLAARFVSDDPPASLLSAAANTFLATDGDLRAVMTTILLSPEFLETPASWHGKVKRPLHLVASLARVLGADPTRLDLDHLRNTVRDMGEELYKAAPPTGYPDASESWAGAGGLVLRLNEIVRATSRVGGYAFEYPATGDSSTEVVDALIARLFAAGVSEETRVNAIAFLATLPPVTPDTRAAQAAAVLLASPEFLQH